MNGDLIKRLREDAEDGYLIQTRIGDDIAEAADAIEELQNSLDGVCADNDSLCKRIDDLQKRTPKAPHGRLGDLDALKEKAIERSEKCGVCVNVLDEVITAFDIETAPTIIPADHIVDGTKMVNDEEGET